MVLKLGVSELSLCVLCTRVLDKYRSTVNIDVREIDDLLGRLVFEVKLTECALFVEAIDLLVVPSVFALVAEESCLSVVIVDLIFASVVVKLILVVFRLLSVFSRAVEAGISDDFVVVRVVFGIFREEG